jgi:hypothetical protein
MHDLKLDSIAPLLAAFAVLGTVVGVILRGWSNIKGFVHATFRLVVTQVHLQDEATAQAVLAHLVRTYCRSALGERTFGGRHEAFRDGQFGHVPFEFFGGHRVLFWIGRTPIWFNVAAEKPDEKSRVIYWGSKPKADMKASLSFVRGTVDVEAVVRTASAARNRLYWENGLSAHRRFFIKRIPDATQSGPHRYTAGTSVAWYQEGLYRLLAHTPDQLGRGADPQAAGRATDRLYFPAAVRALIREVGLWRRLRDWYLARDIPWKRGWVLYGPPGTGKSAITRAIAEDLDMPLFVYSLGQMLNEELERSWAEMQAHVPCVALFEDFDNVFHGRENVYGKPRLSDLVTATGKGGATADAGGSGDGQAVLNIGRLSFDCLLNCLDGVEKGGGIFTVITTNHIDRLDPALGRPRTREDGTVEFISTRPGRIDKAIELGYMDDADKLRLARRIFFDDEAGYRQMRRMVETEPGRPETPAQFQERCAQFALDLMWQAEHAEAGPAVIPGPEANGAASYARSRYESRPLDGEPEPDHRV